MELIARVIVLHRENVQVTKGFSSGQDTPAPFHLIATILYRGKMPLKPHWL